MTAMSATGRPLTWQGRSESQAQSRFQNSETSSSGRRDENMQDDGKRFVLKIGVLGDSQTGKTTLASSYFGYGPTEIYLQTHGINCMRKTRLLPELHLEMNIWELGGHTQYASMLPLVCNDAAAIVITFDLTRISTLLSAKQTYVQARQLNRSADIALVGTKYDKFVELSEKAQQATTSLAMSYAQAMDAAVIFSSVPYNINIHKLFKVLLSRIFHLPCSIPKNVSWTEPVLDY